MLLLRSSHDILDALCTRRLDRLGKFAPARFVGRTFSLWLIAGDRAWDIRLSAMSIPFLYSPCYGTVSDRAIWPDRRSPMADSRRLYCTFCEQTFSTDETEKCPLCGKSGGLVDS